MPVLGILTARRQHLKGAATLPTTIAVISDLHYASSCPIATRQGEWAAVLLLRAVHRLNRYIKPDLVLLLGDCIDDPDGADARELLQELRQIMDLLTCPWLAIPGNHDPVPDAFYEIFPRPAETVNTAGVRVLTFCDPEAPGYNATRTDNDLARMRAARSDGFAGPVIAAQHVALCPAHLQRILAYTYTNLDAALDAAATGGVNLCVGGHSHTNTGVIRRGSTAFLAVDALCEAPFGYTLVTIDDGPDSDHSSRITSRNESLSMPAEYELVDCHSHTQFAYCSEDVHTTRSPQLAEIMGLRALALTEHSAHLYYPVEEYYSGHAVEGDATDSAPAQRRIADYFAATDALRSDRLLVGLEIDADYNGGLVLLDADAARLQIKVGAVHFLHERRQEAIDPTAFAAEFQHVTERLCRTGIDVLAHPFRIFRISKLTPPPALFEWLARHLKSCGVAAEINFHINEPHAEFVRLCVEMGVPLTFGSDAHNLYEVGEFYPHLALLRRIGVTGNPSSVLWDGALSRLQS
jgi:histidinol phosphatase-like PHP family hydrolase